VGRDRPLSRAATLSSSPSRSKLVLCSADRALDAPERIPLQQVGDPVVRDEQFSAAEANRFPSVVACAGTFVRTAHHHQVWNSIARVASLASPATIRSRIRAKRRPDLQLFHVSVRSR